MNVRGLTLIEMLVAMFIMAVLAVLSYRTVSAMVDTSQHVDRKGRQFERLADAVTLMALDLRFMTDVPGEQSVRGNGGNDTRPGELRFARTPSAYQEETARGAVYIAYRLEGDQLQKLVYPAPWVVDAQPEVRPLLDKQVTGLHFRFRDRAGDWYDQWPIETVTGLPLAVEFRLDLADGSNVTRMVVDQ